MIFNLSRRKLLISLIIAAAAVAVTVAILVVVLTHKDNKKTGAVVTNGIPCGEIGRSILEKGGNAVEAAIAAMFCEGVAMPQSTGLGGGFLMTIYRRDTKEVITLNAREMAPEGADKDMYHGDENLAKKGILSVAVPAELRGMWYAYQRFKGTLEWKELVQPTIDLCRSGIKVTKYSAGVFASVSDVLYRDPNLREVFFNAATNETVGEGQYVKRLKLADTLEIIAKEGGDALHNGSLTDKFIEDVQDMNGLITKADLNNYKPQWLQPVKAELPFGQTLYTTPLPGSGIILTYILNILNGFLDYGQPKLFTNWQRVIESFKFGYGRRTEFGDSDFVNVTDLVANMTSPEYAAETRGKIFDDRTFENASYYGARSLNVEDHGTAHISVLAPNGDAVAVTSTINLYFGSGVVSNSTGIILNDQMDDFSSPNITNDFGVPPSEANFIAPGKRPLSSMCPSIIVNEDGDVDLVVGAAGGTKITTSVALVIIKHLWFNMTLEDAVFDKRLHHQLFPMTVQLEPDFSEDNEFLEELTKIGHDYDLSDGGGFAAVTSISQKNGNIEATFDKRRPGNVAYLQ